MPDSNGSDSNERTRLSGFHPYPAMVADELALELARSHVKPGQRVLDPFCGSGRLLVAGASVPGKFVGMDVNPLARLITMAKVVTVSAETISELVSDIEFARRNVRPKPLTLREPRKVQWFPESVLAEIGQIASWINALNLDYSHKTVLATAFSAAVRDASYCRKGRWKLHRLDPFARANHVASAWDCLKRRLQLYVVESTATTPLKGEVSVIGGDAREILARVSGLEPLSKFDLVLTSPPYGDSKTTVQYGAASALCLDAVSRIEGFADFFVQGVNIDRQCLGGGKPPAVRGDSQKLLKRYWAGALGSTKAATVAAFLADISQVFAQVASLLQPGGRAVLVLGRRSVGGFRVKLDLVIMDCLERFGLRLESCQRRVLHDKRLPRTINRFGRSSSKDIRAKGLTKTMSEEFILTFGMPWSSEGKS